MSEESSPPSKRSRRSSSQARSDEDSSEAFVYTGQSESEIPKDLTQVVFDPSVQDIGDWVFTNCKLLQSIEISETVTSIGVETFSGCDALVNVQFHRGLRSIGRSAFFGCRALAEAHFSVAGLEYIAAGAFEECESLRTVSIPSSVETIGDDAFQDCASLTSVSLCEGLRQIGRRTFCRCESLTHIDLPRGLKIVPFCAFSGCDALKTASIPNTVNTIDTSAFDSCRALVEAQLSEGLISIGARAFAMCISLSAVALPSTTERVASHAFHGCLGLLGVEIHDGTDVAIAEECFDGCRSLINVFLPMTSLDVSHKAFSGCKLLEEDSWLDGATGSHVVSKLRNRFDNLPVHRASYNASQTAIDELNSLLSSSRNLKEDNLEDFYGLTPLHIVATSANLRDDIFECLLNRYPLEVIWHQDRYGKTATDYLLSHASNEAILLIQLALRRLIAGTMSNWGLLRWRDELELRCSSIPRVIGTGTRKTHIHAIYEHLGHCINIEATSLMEQALWKLRMKSEQKADSENDHSYRVDCRLQCGSGIVIENVIKYLWNDEAKSDTAFSIYPLCGQHETV